MKRRGFIHRKFTLGFALIFAVSIGCLYAYVAHTLKVQTSKAIASDMRKLQFHAYDLFDHYVLLNDADSLDTEAGTHALLRSLSHSLRQPAAYYNSEALFRGEAREVVGQNYIIEGREPELLQRSAEHDLRLARNNASVVTIAQVEEEYFAILTLPLLVNGELQGMLRISSSYSGSYRHNEAVLRNVGWFSLLLFVVVLFFSYAMSKRVATPIVRLSRAMSRFGQGLREEPVVVRTNDEVEKLADSFAMMKTKLIEQMDRLESDRNTIVQLEGGRRRFYQHMTHELKTPLTTISGYAQIIGQPGFKDAAFLHKAAARIGIESERLHGMVVEIMELSRREASSGNERKDRIELADMLSACCEDMSLLADKNGLRIQYRPAEQLFVKGQSDDLRRLWMNVLDNAVKYAAEGTAILVELSLQSDQAVVSVSNELAEEDRADAEMVFEAFYRARGNMKNPKVTGSMGLGLAICKTIVDVHGGSIAYRSEGKRVTVEARLPVCSQVGNSRTKCGNKPAIY